MPPAFEKSKMQEAFFDSYRADFSWNQWIENDLISKSEKFVMYVIHSSRDIHFSYNRHLWVVNQYIDWFLYVKKLKKVYHYINNRLYI